MSYGIGQHRFKGVGTCTTEVGSSKNYKATNMTGDDTGASF